MATLIVLLAIVTIQAPSAGTATSRTAVQSAPPGWTEAAGTMSSLLRDGKCPEAIAIGEQWVARHPAFADAHLRLGGALESVARGFCGSRAPETRANRAKQFETAAVHLRRGFELGGGESPWIAIRGLLDIYGLGALDRPDEQRSVPSTRRRGGRRRNSNGPRPNWRTSLRCRRSACPPTNSA